MRTHSTSVLRTTGVSVLCVLLLASAACDDDGSPSGSGGAGGSAGSGGSGGSGGNGGSMNKPDAGANDASTSLDGAAGGGNDAADMLTVPPINAGEGCSLRPYQIQSAAQAGLPAQGLKMWLRADQGVYATAAGRVCAWVDHSGANRVFTPISDAERPPLIASAINGKPGIRFGDTLRGVQVNNAIGLPAQSARTFIVVQKLNKPKAQSVSLWQGNFTAGVFIGIESNIDNQHESASVMGTTFVSSLETADQARVHVLSINAMTVGTPVAPAVSYRINGKPLTLTPGTPGNFLDFSATDLTVVGSGRGESDYHLTEALVYDHALSSQELSALESTLAARYGISLQ